MRLFPILCAALLAAPALQAMPPVTESAPQATAPIPDVGIDTEALGRLAVQNQGRTKPMTTLTGEALLTIHGSSVYYPNGKPTFVQRMTRSVPAENRGIDADRVMLDVWLRPEAWQTRPIIYLGHRPLKEALGVDPDRQYFSLSEFAVNPALQQLLQRARMKRAANERAELEPLEEQALSLDTKRITLMKWLGGTAVAIVPHPSEPTGQWSPLAGLRDSYPPAQAQPVFANAMAMRDAYLAGDGGAFNAKLGELASQLRGLSPSVYPSSSLLAAEKYYQDFHPFRWAWICYLLALIVLAVTGRWMARPGYLAGWGLVLTGFVLQVVGFYYRILISGRPPVTNMYETVIWVAFGVVLFAVVLEAIYRSRWFLLAACPAAVLSLILADMQPTVLDPSIHPLVPVLRHNTWLIIHVLTIVSSYAAFLLALALAHIYLVKDGWFARTREDQRGLQELHTFIYRSLQIGVLLLAAGTILGGVWANYSWGRFWGWDPKETWALAALLCYLALIHSRLVGWVRGYGMAVGSVLCFLAILMSWYGVNFILGKGLHSYGFGTGGQEYVAGFVALELGFLGLCELNRRRKGGGAKGGGARGAKRPVSTAAGASGEQAEVSTAKPTSPAGETEKVGA
ncbi:MAG: cytochrome c biogenesis protein CcsA [Verrucomicrobiota bacterium]